MKLPLIVNFRPVLSAKGPVIFVPMDTLWRVEGELEDSEVLLYSTSDDLVPIAFKNYKGEIMRISLHGPHYIKVSKAGRKALTLYLTNDPLPG